MRGPLDSIGLVWSTAWAGDGARTFANLLGMLASCWQEAAQLHHEGSFTISAAAQVRVDGAKAALARGLSEPVLGPAAARAVEFDPRIPAEVPPLGQLPADAAAERPRVSEGRFVSARLGIGTDEKLRDRAVDRLFLAHRQEALRAPRHGSPDEPRQEMYPMRSFRLPAAGALLSEISTMTAAWT